MVNFARAPRERALEVRNALKEIDALDLELRALDEGCFVLWPLRRATEEDATRIGFEIVPLPPGKRLVFREPFAEIKARLGLSPELEALLPRKWELIGDILVLRLPTRLDDFVDSVSATYADVLGARTVCREIGPIEGAYRTPKMVVIHGSGTETVHKENGVLYKLDVARVMFSSGNKAEKLRMSRLDCRNEVVIDMFAGIGYFTLPIAKHAGPAKVIACEINPVAFAYLMENVALNRLENVVEPRLGDNRSLEGREIADRVLMGYVGNTSDFLPKAMSLVKPGGILHYHDVCPIDLFPERPLEHIRSAAGARPIEVLRADEVKSYAPLVSHFVVDVRVG